MRRSSPIPGLLKRALLAAVDHDIFNVAQSTAYSAIIALFPALIVVAALATLIPDTELIRAQASLVFRRVLPGDTIPMLAAYFDPRHQPASSTRALLLGIVVSVSGAGGVLLTLMDGLRRANELAPDCWSFLRRRARAYALVPLSLVPLALSSMLVVFGNMLAQELTRHLSPVIHDAVLVLVLGARWLLASAGSVGLIAVIYKLGTPLAQSWRRVLPGAVLATALWLAATLVFGWYVTRFANYTRVYGSLGAGIALLLWLYLVSLCVLLGAEFNAQLRKARVL